jgi:hypothetical protein
MTTIYFADLDILLKLAACDLLSELCEHWQIPPNQCFVSATFQHTLRGGKIRATNAPIAIDRTAHFLNTVAQKIQLTDSIAVRKEAVALEKTNIDAGEKTLIIATKEPAEQAQPFFLATGDKRAINALAGLPSTDAVCERISKRLQGRVICLESMMLTFIEVLGFEPVKAKVLASRHNDKVAADKTITAAFGSRAQAEEHNVRATLQSYISELPAQLLA